MNRWLIVALFLAAPLLAAADSHAAPGEELPAPNPTESFDQTILTNLLQELYNRAQAALQEYVEIDGAPPQDGRTQGQAGEFRLKLFPHGKSRSQEYVTAEGSFRLSPDPGQQEFTLRFKSSTGPQASQPNDDII